MVRVTVERWKVHKSLERRTQQVEKLPSRLLGVRPDQSLCSEEKEAELEEETGSCCTTPLGFFGPLIAISFLLATSGAES